MAFKFRSKSSTIDAKLTTNHASNTAVKLYPTWLKSNAGPHQLPGIYQGVLGQVQLQSGINIDKKQQQQVDYMNRFTDTERVHQLLLTSQLPEETLAAIWAYVNKTYPGKLTNREVCLSLALIALFQRTEREHFQKPIHQDPFNLVKLEKKPPVPTLHSNHNNRLVSRNQQPINTSVSSNDLLGDFNEHFSSNNIPAASKSISLIDLDCAKFNLVLVKLTQTWMSFMSTMRQIFKRSFDILNVENSRQSAIEALKSKHGFQFSKQLCLCYPMAHNIKLKIDELTNQPIEGSESERLFEKSYTKQMDNLMTSINEYWAVLINLFNEAGQTPLIELVMDGLVLKKKTNASSRNLEELVGELDGAYRADVCSICHSSNYLSTDLTALEVELSEDDIECLSTGPLISIDKRHYYHPRCANFWLNQVDSSGLPFHSIAEEDAILKPNNEGLLL